MKFLNPNDPEFTAKALGDEIETGSSDTSVSDEHQKEFDELSDFAEQLKASVQQEKNNEKLEEERINKIKSTKQKRSNPLIQFPAWIGSIAAILLISFTLPHYLNEYKNTQQPEPPAFIEEESIQITDQREESSDVTNFDLDSSNSSRKTILRSTLDQFKIDLDGKKKQQTSPHKKSTNIMGQWTKNQSAAISLNQQEMKQQITRSAKTNESPKSNKILIANKTDQAMMKEARTLSLAMNPPPQMSHSANDNREGYAAMEENDYKTSWDHPLSTFSIDVDTASYSNMRRMIQNNRWPVPESIRVEELINYFSYDYKQPTNNEPFAVQLDVTRAPWNEKNQLVRIALKGKAIELDQRPDANLVFLIDVSGSMNDPKKLPLVKQSLKHLIRKMSANDRIAIVVYAGASGLALPSTTANNQETIEHALNRLSAGGSTNGGAGIELAYNVANENFITDGINRVILCTDGDFNVGTTSQGSLQSLIQSMAQTNVYFSAIGFGSGNYQDSTMELLSNKGNGNYAYIDSKNEARKVFVENLLGTLYTIAKDVKIQVEFNPNKVQAYRLIGYENRLLNKEDFNNDKKDAGEIGAGHTVTALYEIIPQGATFNTSTVDPLRYQEPAKSFEKKNSKELLTVKLRYKLPEANNSQLITRYLMNSDQSFMEADTDFRFASGVAALGMHLKESPHLNDFNLKQIKNLLINAIGKDSNGYRTELIELIELLEQSKKQSVQFFQQ